MLKKVYEYKFEEPQSYFSTEELTAFHMVARASVWRQVKKEEWAKYIGVYRGKKINFYRWEKDGVPYYIAYFNPNKLVVFGPTDEEE